MAASDSHGGGWRVGIRNLFIMAVTLFLIALLRRWMHVAFAAGLASFVAFFFGYWLPPRPRESVAGWLRICLVLSALFGVWVFLISHIGGATDSPKF